MANSEYKNKYDNKKEKGMEYNILNINIYRL